MKALILIFVFFISTMTYNTLALADVNSASEQTTSLSNDAQNLDSESFSDSFSGSSSDSFSGSSQNGFQNLYDALGDESTDLVPGRHHCFHRCREEFHECMRECRHDGFGRGRHHHCMNRCEHHLRRCERFCSHHEE